MSSRTGCWPPAAGVCLYSFAGERLWTAEAARGDRDEPTMLDDHTVARIEQEHVVVRNCGSGSVRHRWAAPHSSRLAVTPWGDLVLFQAGDDRSRDSGPCRAGPRGSGSAERSARPDQCRGRAGGRVARQPVHRRAPDRSAGLSAAAAAIREAEKFLPDLAGRIPASAFRSEVGRQLLAREPGCFDAGRMEVRRKAYERALRAMSPPARPVFDPERAQRLAAPQDRSGQDPATGLYLASAPDALPPAGSAWELVRAARAVSGFDAGSGDSGATAISD